MPCGEQPWAQLAARRRLETPAGGLPVAIAGSALFYWNVLMRFMENSSSWHRVQPTAAVWQELAALLLLAALARTLYLPGRKWPCPARSGACSLLLVPVLGAAPGALAIGSRLWRRHGGGAAGAAFRLALCCIGGMGLACIGQGKAGNN